MSVQGSGERSEEPLRNQAWAEAGRGKGATPPGERWVISSSRKGSKQDAKPVLRFLWILRD